LDKDFDGDECKQKTHSYQRRFTDNQKEEKENLLEQFREENGKLPDCNSE
jgi:hypothetical protein